MAAVKPTVGFVGLGDMGGRIAKRIVGAGYPTTVFDTRAVACNELAADGAIIADDLAGLARGVDVLGICVVDDAQVTSVVAAIAGHLARGAIVVIHSSVTPDTVRDIATDLNRVGVSVVDAPVSGSRPAADAGTLTVMIGGEPTSVQKLRPVLDTFCANVIDAGAVGAGQALKIANNIMLHMNHLVVLEAVKFARSQGIGEEAVINTANACSGRSWVTETWGLLDAMLVDHPLAGTDAIYPLMSKEMWHALEIGRQTATALPLTALGTQISEASFRQRELEAVNPRNPANQSKGT